MLVKEDKWKNNYLEIIYKYYRMHKKKTTITVACIAAAICMITTVFSLADIGIDVEIQAVKNIYGNYHMKVENLSFEITDIEKIEGISHAGWLVELPTGELKEKECRILCGDADIIQQFDVRLLEGQYAKTGEEVVIDKKVKKDYALKVGDVLPVRLEGKTYNLDIVGVCDTFSSLTARDVYGLLLSVEGGRILGNSCGDYYITCQNVEEIDEVKCKLIEEYHLEENRIQLNEILLSVMGKGKSVLAANLYLIAGILFCLVFLVSILMITNCLNISVHEKKQLYGLLRCIGADSKQLRRCVQKEGKILWCHSIPAGIGSGVVLTWCCLLLLRLLNKDMFENIFVFQVSIAGIVIGIFTGLAAVMIATVSPVRYVCSIPPLTAINEETYQKDIKCRKKRRTIKIPVELLISLRQTGSNRKSLGLMIASFAMNIVLIFAFSVMINFIYEGSYFTKPYNPDASIYNKEGKYYIHDEVKWKIEEISGVESVVGRKVNNAELEKNGNVFSTLLVSYDKQQFEWIESKIISGKLNIGRLLEGEEILVDEESGLEVGDEVLIKGNGGNTIACVVGGVLRNFPYDSADSVRCLLAEALFQQVVGNMDYSILDIRFSKGNEEVWELMTKIIPEKFSIFDYRQKKEESKNQFLTMAVFVYGFCGTIIAVTIFNIINCMSISVWNNMKKYGMICAVGGTTKQCKKIVILEALLYACGGGALGIAIGVPLHYYLYSHLVAKYFNTVWRLPVEMIITIIGITIFTAIVSSLMPLQKVKEINIIEIIRQV